MEFRADKYYRYDELMTLLTSWKTEYADIMQFSSIGKSYQGRDIPVVTLSNAGDSAEKPAVLFVGGIHSREFVGSSVVIYALHDFLTRATEEEIHQILTEKTIYFIPRVNVDGMEENLAGRGNYRGSLKPFHKVEDGVYTTDIDGDGRIAQMRIADPNGEWVCAKDEPRLMVRRTPADEGPFYQVFPEGLVRGSLDRPLKAARLECDMDPNREFPFDWSRKAIGETLRYAAGNYPLEDAETRALADFIVSHNNIHTLVDEHSYMGGYISPMEFYKEMPSPPEDSMMIYEIGEAASEETGMMHANIFPLGFQDIAHGSFTPWTYFERGIVGWCCENWNIQSLYSVVDKDHPIKKMEPLMSPDEILETRKKLLAWDDEKNEKQLFLPWHTFEHPQLGTIEIGGFCENYSIWNPPENYLEEECKRSMKFMMRCIRAASQLILEDVTVQETETGYRLSASLYNKGLFPSYGTRQALQEEMTTLGKARMFVQGQLVKETVLPEIYGNYRAEVVLDQIKAKKGDEYCLEILTERAGVIRKKGIL